ncbi:L,D-transpeptidase family protein [Novosphingobium aquae]|jgi:murein L,D-transpeptidase YcbB/YkuD|uniref:L,D-transpeptidase family protein n=1 Tax=Novosphingobium aquae TaxID=3133435 RepID=A0ABU8SAV9_9SPHN
MKFSRMAQFAAVTAMALAILPAGAIAQSSAPAPVAPAAQPVIVPAPVATSPSAPAAKPGETAAPVTATVQPLPAPAPVAPDPNPVMAWSLANAKALATVIEGIGKEGLTPADYQPAALRAAIAKGEGPELDAVASKSFTWLTEDLRDGRTPMKARVQWFAFDKDMDVNPTVAVMSRALDSGDIAGTLAALNPTYPDYAELRDALTKAPDAKTRNQIRANMDRWRWLSHDLGEYYLITNVPEFQLRLVRKDKIVRTYRTIVGKPGRTATPQLSEMVEGVVFNPTWTVPQSIVKGEGLGAQLMGNPASAKAQGYVVTKGADGMITVVQQPGPKNALGLMKLDMPNEHAIFLHDTPSRGLFNSASRALSHGCVRTERATELAIALAIIGGGKTADEAAEISASGVYTKVPMAKRPMPVYIGYFTYAKSIDGVMKAFPDIYLRDAPVLASLAAPRQLKTAQRKSTEAVIKLDNPL